jgi:hypothetical protein
MVETGAEMHSFHLLVSYIFPILFKPEMAGLFILQVSFMFVSL